MKKSALILFGLMLWTSAATFAYDPDYFIGTWDVLISDTPQEMSMKLTLERVEGKLIGKFTPIGSEQGTTISNIEQENGLILFLAEGYDLYLSLNAAEGDKLTAI